MTNYYRPGDWYAICDVCGFKYHGSQLRLRWDGLRVCPKDFEYRNRQDFVKVIPDHPTPAWTRPQPPDVFETNTCTIQGRSAIAGHAVAGCMVAGLNPEF